MFFPDFSAPMVQNFVNLVYCVLSARSLSLYKCAEYAPGDALFDSKYRRILRFIRTKRTTLFCCSVARLILSMAPEGSLLVIDRTNWKRGEQPINLLCLGLVIHGSFYLPLLCEPLPKHGSSSEEERIALIKQLITLSGTGKGFTLLADREFEGKNWIRWLRNQGIELVIRLREKDYFNQACAHGEEYSTLEQFRREVHRKGNVTIRFKLEGYWFYYTGLIDRTIGGDVFYLLSSRPCARESSALYAKRWTIETFFKQMKTAGFNLESTGLADFNRLKMLMAVGSMAYLVALSEGLVAARKNPVKIKQSVGRQNWPAVSIFRYGLRSLVEKTATLSRFWKSLKRLCNRKKRQYERCSLYEIRQSVQY